MYFIHVCSMWFFQPMNKTWPNFWKWNGVKQKAQKLQNYNLFIAIFGNLRQGCSYNYWSNTNLWPPILIPNLWSIRDGSGQFFTSWVGFRVFQFCSGWVSGFCIFPRVKKFWLRVQVFFKNHIYLSLIWGLVPIKVWVRWLGSGKYCLRLRKNYYWC